MGRQRRISPVLVVVLFVLMLSLVKVLSPGAPKPKPGGGEGASQSPDRQSAAPVPTIPPYTIDLSGITLPQGKAPQSDTISLFFCLDVSGSMGNAKGSMRKIDISKEAMRKVFEQIAAYVGAHPEKKVKVGLSKFNKDVQILQPLEAFNSEKLQQLVQRLEPGGSTAIGDALSVALGQVLAAGDETKAILVMTDGENTDGVPPDRVMQAIKKNTNSLGVSTADTEVFLVAFDVDGARFKSVKDAGALVVESRDQKSLEGVMGALVEKVLLEAP